MRFLAVLPFLLAPAVRGQNFAQYIIHNNCFYPLMLWSGPYGAYEGVLPIGNTTLFKDLDISFWSDTHCGDPGPTGPSVRAEFHLRTHHYYILQNPDHFNVALKIQPTSWEWHQPPPAAGFCPTIECDNSACASAFTSEPSSFPSPGSTPPLPPLYECPFDNVTYHITFCPRGPYTTDYGLPTHQLHPRGVSNKCLNVRGGTLANGNPVDINDCTGSAAQKWEVDHWTGAITLAGSVFCLDVGNNSTDGTGLTISQCIDSATSQQFNYASSNAIQVVGTSKCLDLRGGFLTNGNQIQLWTCGTGNTNQVWTMS